MGIVNIKLHGYSFTYHEGLEKPSKKNYQVKKRVVIIGAGGHARVVADIISLNDDIYDFYGFIDSSNSTSSKNKSLNVLGTENDLLDLVHKYRIFGGIVAVGDNSLRKKIVASITNICPEFKFINCIHPSAVISSNTSIGIGNVFMPGSIINTTTKIGDHNIFNTNSSVDHDNDIRDFVSIGPCAKTGGKVTIYSGSAISIGATVVNDIVIERNCIIGSNSLVNKNTKPYSVYYGTPAIFIRKYKLGDPYL